MGKFTRTETAVLIALSIAYFPIALAKRAWQEIRASFRTG